MSWAGWSERWPGRPWRERVAADVEASGSKSAEGPLMTGPHAFLILGTCALPGEAQDACWVCSAPERHPIHFDVRGVPLAVQEAAGAEAAEPVTLPPAGLEAALYAAAFPTQEPPQAPAPEPLPEDVIGYVVITRRLPGQQDGTVAWLATADLMGLAHAEHVADVTGGVIAEVRAVDR